MGGHTNRIKGKTMIEGNTMSQGKRALYRVVCVIVLALCASDCSDPVPIRLGFVGGISGTGSDLGSDARNGVLLAIEEANAEGGIQGRPLEILTKDDQQDKALVRNAVKELIDAKVEAIIGPTTSEMAMASVDIVNQAKVLMMGVTVTTSALSEKDDFFMRGLSASSIHSTVTAEYIFHQRKIDNFSAIIDQANSAYSQSWINDFSRHFSTQGGRENNIYHFYSGTYDTLPELARQIVQTQPGIVLLVTNAVDAALLAKLLRSEAPNLPLAMAEWAGTRRLIELGGSHVENTIIPQYFDRESSDPAYQSFRQRFMARFNHEPDFPGLTAYNVTQAVLTGLKTRSPQRPLRDELIATGTFNGIQGLLVFDEFGDAKSRTFITEIQNGRFTLRQSP
jgi:branched-chain amino acid transport system substrate-binding protein